MPYTPDTWANGDPSKPVNATRLTKLGSQYPQVMADLPAKIADSGDPIGAALNSTIGSVGKGRTAAFGAPSFSRLNDGDPIMTVATQNPGVGAASPTTAGTIYWPFVLDAGQALGGDALDEFYLYYSTDHDGSVGGIWLATGPTEIGPWTGRGRVYVDTVSGTQTETPSVYPDPTGEYALIMLYHNSGVSGAVGVQTTMWARSDDGITWTRGAIAVDVPSDWPSDGHTGYQQPHLRAGRVISLGLAGGTNDSRCAISESANGRTFTMDPRPLGYSLDQTLDGRNISWSLGRVVLWRGAEWWVGVISDFASGADPKDGRIVAVPIASDWRHFLGKPVVQLYPTAGGETTNYRAAHPFVARDGRLILIYQCDGSFYAAEAV